MIYISSAKRSSEFQFNLSIWIVFDLLAARFSFSQYVGVWSYGIAWTLLLCSGGYLNRSSRASRWAYLLFMILELNWMHLRVKTPYASCVKITCLRWQIDLFWRGLKYIAILSTATLHPINVNYVYGYFRWHKIYEMFNLSEWIVCTRWIVKTGEFQFA